MQVLGLSTHSLTVKTSNQNTLNLLNLNFGKAHFLCYKQPYNSGMIDFNSYP